MLVTPRCGAASARVNCQVRASIWQGVVVCFQRAYSGGAIQLGYAIAFDKSRYSARRLFLLVEVSTV